MKRYSITGGTFRLGLGEVCELSDDQLAARRHKVTIIQAKSGAAICRAEAVLEFKAGETIKLATEPPKSMSAVIVAVDPDPPRPRSASKPPRTRHDAGSALSAEEREAAILAAIPKVDEAGVGGDGVPDVKAIEAIVGFDISAAERDAAWRTFKGAQG